MFSKQVLQRFECTKSANWTNERFQMSGEQFVSTANLPRQLQNANSQWCFIMSLCKHITGYHIKLYMCHCVRKLYFAVLFY